MPERRIFFSTVGDFSMKTVFSTMKSSLSMRRVSARAALGILCAFALLALGGAGVFAQTPTGGGALAQRIDPQKMTERRVAHLKKTLSLTDEQVAKIQPIILQATEKGQKIAQDAKSQRKATAEALKANMDASDEQIKAVLTPEQRQKFDEMRDNQRAKIQDRLSKRRAKKNEE
jgi:Spy/CpxP family protein refolding chaperone